ncbi:response regulator [Massilia sp. LXY-6]|uniref:response regulator n=1 Tax=Massilia sp. LXY-6 TaxID=3379823 RepID=UPI003EDFD688
MNPPGPPGGEASTAPAPRKILLIDDNDDAREMLGMALELKGHAIVTAESGASGLAHADRFRPDFIFLDLGMPVMDGYDTAIALRRIAGLERVTVVALSGWNDQETLARVRNAGFDHHLTKPASFDHIDRILRGDIPPFAMLPLRQASRHL